MNPNGRFPIRKVALPGELANAQGGSLINRIPKPVVWDAFVSCGIRVWHDGKLVVLALDGQTLLEDANEAVAVLLLLMGMLTPKQGPLDWETVPENVRRHFREVDTTTLGDSS